MELLLYVTWVTKEWDKFITMCNSINSRGTIPKNKYRYYKISLLWCHFDALYKTDQISHFLLIGEVSHILNICIITLTTCWPHMCDCRTHILWLMREKIHIYDKWNNYYFFITKCQHSQLPSRDGPREGSVGDIAPHHFFKKNNN